MTELIFIYLILCFALVATAIPSVLVILLGIQLADLIDEHAPDALQFPLATVVLLWSIFSVVFVGGVVWLKFAQPTLEAIRG